jgi:hypothetical protein
MAAWSSALVSVSHAAVRILATLLLSSPQAVANEGTPETTTTPSWELPAEGSCIPDPANPDALPDTDAGPPSFKPGDIIELEKTEVLRDYLPREVWGEREYLLYEGMAMEIGPCYRDYRPPGFYREASLAFRGQPKLTETNGLTNYTAGQPFLPEDIKPGSPESGVQWAWNSVHRYQGGGSFFGKYRAAHLLNRAANVTYYLGEMYQVVTAGRADRAKDSYRVPDHEKSLWVATGHFDAPEQVRGTSWLLYRKLATLENPLLSDDAFRYIPELKRVRRVPPIPHQSHLPVTAEEVRPNRFRWRVVATRDMLAPMNIRKPIYPEVAERSFGPWGVSFASDRWELRRVLVLEATAIKPDQSPLPRTLFYFDLQTLHLLYSVSFRPDGEAVYPSYYVRRWSEDRPDYPRWLDDPEREVRILDVVGEVIFTTGGGCRLEAWNTVGIPPSDKELKRELSSSYLPRRGR